MLYSQSFSISPFRITMKLQNFLQIAESRQKFSYFFINYDPLLLDCFPEFFLHWLT